MLLQLFVMSDLHAFDSSKIGSNEPPSFFDIGQTEASGNNPIADLKELIKRDTSIRAEYLVFCGDLADKGVPTAAERGWREVQEIGVLLGDANVFATAGNHDVDSRYNHNDHDAKGCLLDLKPGFPVVDANKLNHYWTHHFVIQEPPAVAARFLIVNSSGYHGETGPEGATVKELSHGRVSARTLARLIHDLDGGSRKVANIAVIHHHPQKQKELKLGDYDDMQGGYEFLNALDPVKYGPWLVIHGHKHFPKLSYAQGDNTSPVVFSCGSCAAIPYPEIQQHAGPQVYLITLDLTDTSATSCYGTFRAWDWASGRGWDNAQPRTGLPASGGFGNRCDIGKLAQEIASFCPSGRSHWMQVQDHFPMIRFLIPADLDAVVRVLKLTFSYRVETAEGGLPILLEK